MGCWKVISTVGKKENQVSWGIGVPREKVQLIWIRGEIPRFLRPKGSEQASEGSPKILKMIDSMIGFTTLKN